MLDPKPGDLTVKLFGEFCECDFSIRKKDLMKSSLLIPKKYYIDINKIEIKYLL